MSKSITFTVPGAAVGKGRPRIIKIAGQSRMKTPEKTASYENLVKMAAQTAMAGRAPMDGPVQVALRIFVAIPQSFPKWKREAAMRGDVVPTTKPDIDNVLKAIADACNGIVFVDDKQMSDVLVMKRYSDTPRTVVEVSNADPIAVRSEQKSVETVA